MKRKIALLMLSILLIACGLLPSLSSPTSTATVPPTATSTATTTFTPSPTSTPTATPLPTIIPPTDPESGFSNVYGRVLWRGLPVEGIDMDLSCPGHSDEVETNADGVFVFKQVPPVDGECHLEADISVKSELRELVYAHKKYFTPASDANNNTGEYYLAESDLMIISPQAGYVFDDTPVSLEWQAYPGAATYRVYLSQEAGNYTDAVFTDLTEPRLNLTEPLLDCRYNWNVTAFDAEGRLLASSGSEKKPTSKFSIQDDELPSCHIKILSPAHGETITTGLVILKWEPHPLAFQYHMTITKTVKIDVSPFVNITAFYDEIFGILPDGSPDLPPLPYFGSGGYSWKMQALSEDGRVIAQTLWGFSVP